MKHSITQQELDPQRILTSLAELDSLYYPGNFQAYEQAWQILCQEVEQTFPGFTIAYAELYNAGSEREPLGSVRHVLAPLPERNAQ